MMSRLIFLCQIAFLVMMSVLPLTAQAQTAGIGPEPTKAPVGQTLRLSPEAAQVADEIGVTLEIEKLKGGTAKSPMSLETLVVRQNITEKVLAASLDVDSVNAIIDSEIEQIRAIRSDLQKQRDKAQNIINVASLVTGGVLGVVNTALQFSSKTANLGNGIGVGGGATSVVLTVVGIRQRGGQRTLGDSPRMLARFFGRQPSASEAIPSAYPEDVWSYLNSTMPSEQTKGTRREQLIAKWRSENKLERDSSSKSERHIDASSGNISQSRKLSISELDDHVAMLLDIRARVSLMKRELAEILRSLDVLRSTFR
jgi:hypothetical protein